MSKKKRAKQYQPAENQPTIHRYVAEEEEKTARSKTIKRRFILWGALLAILALFGSWVF